MGRVHHSSSGCDSYRALVNRVFVQALLKADFEDWKLIFISCFYILFLRLIAKTFKIHLIQYVKAAIKAPLNDIQVVLNDIQVVLNDIQVVILTT